MLTEKLGYVNIYTVNIYFGIVSPTFSKAEQKKGKKEKKKVIHEANLIVRTVSWRAGELLNSLQFSSFAA